MSEIVIFLFHTQEGTGFGSYISRDSIKHNILWLLEGDLYKECVEKHMDIGSCFAGKSTPH
eukprot:c39601_g1_i1 orf=12-194(+)